MAAAFAKKGKQIQNIQTLRDALSGKKLSYSCKPFRFNRTGSATGELIGGNLSLLAHITGTKSDIKTKGKILFLEDVGEQLYNIDRMLLQLKRSGKLDQLAGLIVGGFTELKDTDRPFGKKIEALIFDHVKEFSFPVCFHFPVSHSTENYALKCGATFQLTVTGKTVRLLEQ
jgi:muramoyltetrapeptide carboxypeptidase